MRDKLKKVWYGVIGILPVYGAYSGFQNNDLLVGLLAGLILAGILYAITWVILFVVRRTRR